ncbi:SIS domain-containing protein [Rubellimicrobium roseum]|uniref:SIS domain-containing protein n=2 Tax=Rubellimicrobium roseum TaxID=687525 RepID=A0A5C4N8M3_9RHOB|nr:SIS domain-containing protein [Rubellimicrobium roseum]
MADEIAEAPAAFLRAALQPAPAVPPSWRAAYTVARGSSDAAAAILAYEFMRETGRPVTSLPPSIFSLGEGVALDDVLLLLISQSGASEDLVRSARGARARGAHVVALTNVEGSPVEQEAQATLPIGAGPELAVPATKTVVGAVGAGMALLAGLVPDYAPRATESARAVARLGGLTHPRFTALRNALESAGSVYVIGRDTGFGAAQEIALKLKECAALHAEAYSASEVLHGPLQLATEGLTVLLLDTDAPGTSRSLATAEARFSDLDATVLRVAPSDVGAGDLTPAAAAALLLCLLYPVVHAVALARGHDPDAPETLSKVTRTT